MSEGSPTIDALPWLVRIPQIFEGVAEEILDGLGAGSVIPTGRDFYQIKTETPAAIRGSEWGKFVRWNLPIEHSWSCNPRTMEGYIEKVAQALVRKFGGRKPQGVFVGQLNPEAGERYFKQLSTNLRGRVLQLFPELTADHPEDQDPSAQSLFCLLGKEGIFCGMISPREANGFYPGGSKFIAQGGEGTISRAGAKIAEALHYLGLYRDPPPFGTHWLELGAAPGGMTSELLARGQRVTAIDRAPLDQRLLGKPGLTAVHADVATFQPAQEERFGAILSDLNCPPLESIAHVVRLSRFLEESGLVVFTLKLPQVENTSLPREVYREVVDTAESSGLHLFATTHLTYNRNEFTLFFEMKGF